MSSLVRAMTPNRMTVVGDDIPCIGAKSRAIAKNRTLAPTYSYCDIDIFQKQWPRLSIGFDRFLSAEG